jgi:polysaccharide export outer membrane protein
MAIVTRAGLLLLILAGWLGVSGCVSGSSEKSTPASASNPRIPETSSSAVVRPGDSLTIALQGVPDPSVHSVQIDDRGLITLPYIGAITAAGLSASDLSQRIRETYIAKKFYTTVDVLVSVTERYVYIGGEVGRPGRIVWTPDLTASKAIQAAGGFSLYAKETAVNLVRENRPYPLDIKLAQKDPTQDPRLMPGDSLQVSRSAF